MGVGAIVTIAVIVILLVYGVMIYNNLVTLKHGVTKAWSNIDVLLKQRNDELPKLVETCKQYMQYEQETLERVMKARAAVAAAREKADVGALGPAESELRLGLGVNYRSSMRTASADAPDTETGETGAVPAYTFLDWNMGIRVMSVLIYFRFDNMSRQLAGDLPGLPFPVTRSAFGVKWTFLN